MRAIFWLRRHGLLLQKYRFKLKYGMRCNRWRPTHGTVTINLVMRYVRHYAGQGCNLRGLFVAQRVTNCIPMRSVGTMTVRKSLSASQTNVFFAL